MNYTALYATYIDRALLSIKESSVSDDIWPDYFGFDDGDLERTMWAGELAEKISDVNLGDLPLSIFCYEVLEAQLSEFFQKQYAFGQRSAKSSAVTYIQVLIDDMQDVLKKRSARHSTTKIWVRIGAYIEVSEDQKQTLIKTRRLPAGAIIEFDGESYIPDCDDDELNELEFDVTPQKIASI